MTHRNDEKKIPLRRYALIHALLDSNDTTIWVAQEAVATTILAHPEWDWDEEKTWQEWEAGPT